MKTKFIKIIIFILIFIVMLLIQNEAKAAYVSISASKKEIKVGESVTITISSDCTGKINLSASNEADLSASQVWVEGNSQTVTMTAKKTGTVNVEAKPITLATSDATDLVINGLKNDKVNVSVGGTKTCSVNVTKVNETPATPTQNTQTNTATSGSTTSNTTTPSNTTKPDNTTSTQTQKPQEEQKKSSDATLNNLGFTPHDFKGFKAGTTTYSAEVPNDVTGISIYATTKPNQKVTGTGWQNVKEGENQFKVVVTAEDGKTQKTYTINVTKKAVTEPEKQDKNEVSVDDKIDEETTKDESKKDEAKEEKTTVGLSKLVIDGIKLSPTFEKDKYEYTAKLIGDKTKLTIDTTAIDKTQNIEIVGNEDLKEGENIITILVTDEKGENTTTYQITLNKSLIDEEAIAKNKLAEEKKQQRLIVIGSVVAAIIVISIILIARIIKHDGDDYEEEFEDDYDEELEEIYDDEEYEEVKPKRKNKGKRFK